MYDIAATHDAERFGILGRMERLEADLMRIEDIGTIYYSLESFADHGMLILLPKYVIDVNRADYYAARGRQLDEIISVCAKHDLHRTSDRIEDYQDRWYIVMRCGEAWQEAPDEIVAFVNNLVLNGAELQAVTIDEAQHAMNYWVRDGVELPSSMTAQRFMTAWNEMVCAEYRKRFGLIDRIVARAEEMGIGSGTRVTQMMDIQNADKQFHLRLEEFVNAEPMDFTHDYCGIQREINRGTGRIEGFFVPVFAGD